MIDGLPADVVTLALAYDIDAIARQGLIAQDWQKRLPQNSSPYTSTIVFLVRTGNPKNIKDWDDLVRARRQGDHAESEDLRRRALELSRRLGLCAEAEQAATRRRRKDFVKAIYKNVPVLDTGARGSTITFVERGVGDVLHLLGERGVPRASTNSARTSSRSSFRRSRSWPSRRSPSSTRVVDKKGTRAAAEAYLNYLYSKEGQEIAGQAISTARAIRRVAKKYEKPFPKVNLFTIDEVFGGWAGAQKTHFDDKGIFDEIYSQ